MTREENEAMYSLKHSCVIFHDPKKDQVIIYSHTNPEFEVVNVILIFWVNYCPYDLKKYDICLQKINI